MVEHIIRDIKNLRRMREGLAWFQSKPRTSRIVSLQKILEQAIEVTKLANAVLRKKER